MRHRRSGVVIGTVAGIYTLVTGSAGGGQGVAAQGDTREAMAIGAGRIMRPGQREPDGRVIKCCTVGPGGEVAVAHGAAGSGVGGRVMLDGCRPRRRSSQIGTS